MPHAARANLWENLHPKPPAILLVASFLPIEGVAMVKPRLIATAAALLRLGRGEGQGAFINAARRSL